jgi:hypothetical protein
MSEFRNIQKSVIQLEFQQLMTKLKSDPPKAMPRTWGFELETPEADAIYSQATRRDLEVIEFHEDPSVSEDDGYSDECYCECRECTYHSCNCDDCEVEGSEDPEHGCGGGQCYSKSSQYQEIVSVGGLDTTHPEALAVLDRLNIKGVRITELCGLHIHIFSGDLTPLQVGRVLTGYRLAAEVLTAISGEERQQNRFCQLHEVSEEQACRQGRESDKYRAVNTLWHFRGVSPNNYGNRPATLEFRQHEGTNDTARIRAWAWLMVQLVEFAKSDRPLYWVGKARNLTELLKAIR